MQLERLHSFPPTRDNKGGFHRIPLPRNTTTSCGLYRIRYLFTEERRTPDPPQRPVNFPIEKQETADAWEDLTNMSVEYMDNEEPEVCEVVNPSTGGDHCGEMRG